MNAKIITTEKDYLRLEVNLMKLNLLNQILKY